MARVTEITDAEEVRDGFGNLLYVELLVAVFDRDDRDPPAARVIGTEKVRISPGLSANRRRIRHIHPVTGEQLDAYDSTVVQLPDVVTKTKSDAQARIEQRENNSIWPAELLSN